jgi:hypothetical protein
MMQLMADERSEALLRAARAELRRELAISRHRKMTQFQSWIEALEITRDALASDEEKQAVDYRISEYKKQVAAWQQDDERYGITDEELRAWGVLPPAVAEPPQERSETPQEQWVTGLRSALIYRLGYAGLDPEVIGRLVQRGAIEAVEFSEPNPQPSRRPKILATIRILDRSLLDQGRKLKDWPDPQ